MSGYSTVITVNKYQGGSACWIVQIRATELAAISMGANSVVLKKGFHAIANQTTKLIHVNTINSARVMTPRAVSTFTTDELQSILIHGREFTEIIKQGIINLCQTANGKYENPASLPSVRLLIA